MSLVQGSSTSASAVFLEVESFQWVAEDRLELRGRWTGVRGIRLVRPTVVLDLPGGGQKRLLASLEHKPWTPVEGEPWLAAFAWTGLPIQAEAAQLSVGTGLSFAIPTPSANGGKPVPPPTREQQAEASRQAAQRERETANRALESLKGEFQDLESRMHVTLAQRDEARQRRDQMRAQLDSAVTARQEAMAIHDAAVDERDDAIVSRDAAIADREETLEARNQAIRARQVAERELDKTQAQRDTALQERDDAIARRDDAVADAKRARKLAETAELERRVAVQAAEDARNAIVPRGQEAAAPAAPSPAHEHLIADLKNRVADLEEDLGRATKARRKALAERDDALQRLQQAMEPLEPRNAPTRVLRQQGAKPQSERDEWSPAKTWIIRAVALFGLVAVVVGVILELVKIL